MCALGNIVHPRRGRVGADERVLGDVALLQEGAAAPESTRYAPAGWGYTLWLLGR